MTLGFVMLCHNALHRAAQVARHLAQAGCPVVIHLDRRVRNASWEKLQASLRDLDNVRCIRTRACEWGTWGLVAATQDAARVMVDEFPDVGHVYLMSGSCLPLRPIDELRDYLKARPDTDFIESVTTADVGWTVGGLNSERFTLRFPFSWRRHRRLFDAYVRLQRRLKVCRRIPDGLVPHLGSQWWCLTRSTLTAILDDPRRGAIDRYFRRVWIPDESYFQTLVRVHSRDVESRSLTLSKFDFQGKPHLFYDDHLQLLRLSDAFFARKIWPQAYRLYREFLERVPAGKAPRMTPNPGRIDRIFARATDRRVRGRPGLLMQSRFPRAGREHGVTAAPYSIFEGFDQVFEGFAPWLARLTGHEVHGHLYALDKVHFAGEAELWAGGLSDRVELRDYETNQFLTSLIWNTRGTRQCFQFGPQDNQAVGDFIRTDPNAQISVISGAWALGVFAMKGDFAEQRREAARLQKIEHDHLMRLRFANSKAQIRIWTLAEFLEDPVEPLQQILGDIAPGVLNGPIALPRMVDLGGFGRFVQELRNQGMQPVLLGDIAPGDALPSRLDDDSRPHLVKL